MADDFLNVLSSTDQIRNNYEQFKSKFVDKDKDLISQETFLKLLLAEMSNQDPLEPTTNTEFISQLAQFSSMQYMQDSSKYAMATYASSLVGKTVSASKFDGPDLIMKTGVVQSVKYQNNTYIVTIDGEDFDISKVTSIVDGSASGTQTPDSLADRIARASQMVGMYAWVKTGQTAADGSELFVQGFIESIIVKDGEIKIVIGGEAYSMEDIDELTYATVVENPDKTEDPDDVEGVDPAEPSDPDNVDGDVENAGGTTDPDDMTDVPDIDEGTGGTAPEISGEEEQELLNQLQDLISSMM